ncbi:MAG: hypothetical protein ACRESI_06450 [Gammaproteobacteria bacterium]
MRTFGRVINGMGVSNWYEIDTDANGFNDDIYLTTLIQNLKLNLGESPFYATAGIPSLQSVVQQIFPDYYVSLIAQQFSAYLVSVQIGRKSSYPLVYQVNVIAHTGAKFQTDVEVPQ